MSTEQAERDIAYHEAGHAVADDVISCLAGYAANLRMGVEDQTGAPGSHNDNRCNWPRRQKLREPFASTSVRADGRAWVVVKRACEALGIDVEPQRRTLAGLPWAVTTIMVATAGDGKGYESLCLDLDSFAGWLFTINPRKVRPELRESLCASNCGAQLHCVPHKRITGGIVRTRD